MRNKPTETFPCSLCRKVFASMEAVRMHEKSYHKKAIRKVLEKLNNEQQ